MGSTDWQAKAILREREEGRKEKKMRVREGGGRIRGEGEEMV